MKQDDVLAAIRDHLRAERADDAALEAVARGEGGSDVAALEARAAAGDVELAAMIEATRPLGDAAEARIAATIVKPRAATPATPAKPPASAKPPSPEAGRVLPFTRRAAVYLAPLAVAAAIVLYVLGGGRTAQPVGTPLPTYSVLASSEQEMRGQDDVKPATTLVLRGGANAGFEIVARPATAAGAKVVAYVFAIGEGESNPVDANVDIAPEGSIRIRGRARSLAGARELRVVIGTPDSITRFDDALAYTRATTTPPSVRVLTIPIQRP